MVIDLSDLGASTAVNSTGQSGHAFHPHYEDQLDDWADGDHRPMRWTREQITSEGAEVLTLIPSS
jgi:penicillin amidase